MTKSCRMSLAVDHKKRRSIVRGDQIHPGKPCGPCCLCLRDQPSYTHVVSMQQEQRLWLLNYEQPDQIAFVDDVLRMSANIWERNRMSLCGRKCREGETKLLGGYL